MLSGTALTVLIYALPALMRIIFFKSPPPRIVLVTGASTGLGKLTTAAIATAFPSCYVYGTSRNAATAVVGVKKSRPGQVMLIQLDVTDQASVNACITAIVEHHGMLDVLVNNAGICWSTRAASTLATDAEKQFDTNIKGPIRMSSAVAPQMLAQQAEHGSYGRSKIINISSAGGLTALPYMSLYSASKAALSAYSDSLRMEVMRYGVAVSVVEPGDLKPGQSGCFHSEDFPMDPVAVRAEEICRANEADGTDPEQLAQTVVSILRTSRPAGHYLVGPDAYLVAYMCNRILPRWLAEVGIMWWYSVPRSAPRGDAGDSQAQKVK